MVDVIFFEAAPDLHSVGEARAISDDDLIEVLTVPHLDLVWYLFESVSSNAAVCPHVAQDSTSTVTVHRVPDALVRRIMSLTQSDVEAIAGRWASHLLWGENQVNPMDLQGFLYSLKGALAAKPRSAVYLWVEHGVCA